MLSSAQKGGNMKFTKRRISLFALVVVTLSLGIIVEYTLPRMFVVPHRSSSTQTPTSFTAFDVITRTSSHSNAGSFRQPPKIQRARSSFFTDGVEVRPMFRS